MNKSMTPAYLGVACAIAITTAMDATGYSIFSALPLFPLIALFWYLQKFSRQDIGLVLARPGDYGLALAYPILVLGVMIAIAFAAGAVDLTGANWHNARLNILAGSTIGVLMVMITEEGFFRGWLWAALERAGKSRFVVLIWTTIAFTLWHISAISLDTGFDLPAAEIPVYLVNATLLGAVFGLFRMYSGSVLVPSICHAVWNGIDYPLFGFGEDIGALGIQQTHIFGPEVGLVGIAVNSIAFVALAWLLQQRSNSVARDTGQ